MKNYMLQELKDAEKNNIIVSLFDNKNNPDLWNKGLIDVMTENEIIIKSISREGRYDGTIKYGYKLKLFMGFLLCYFTCMI